MSGLQLTVIGSAGTHPGPGRMCSSYLVEADGFRLLLDCGNGSLANLQQRASVADLDAVLLSHLHPDHFADLYGLYYALRFLPDGPGSVPVYAPEGAREFIARLLPPDSTDSFAQVCRFHRARAGDTLALGPLQVELFEAYHPIETLACRVGHAGGVLAYSADSAYSDRLSDCARDADLFVCDASWLERDGPHPEGVHMTGAQAGLQAAAAGARRLLVTHVYPTVDPLEVVAEASRTFAGEVRAAADLQVHGL